MQFRAWNNCAKLISEVKRLRGLDSRGKGVWVCNRTDGLNHRFTESLENITVRVGNRTKENEKKAKKRRKRKTGVPSRSYFLEGGNVERVYTTRARHEKVKNEGRRSPGRCGREDMENGHADHWGRWNMEYGRWEIKSERWRVGVGSRQSVFHPKLIPGRYVVANNYKGLRPRNAVHEIQQSYQPSSH